MCGCMNAHGASTKLPGPRKNIEDVVGGVNTMNYPVDDFIGGRSGGSTAQVDGVTSGKHRIIYFLVLAAVAYGLWHYSQTR